MDQTHKQINALVKGNGGAVGLTENPGALRRWMVEGPEIARQVDEFEDGFDEVWTTFNVTPADRHHERTKSVQEKVVHDVRSLVTTIEEMGNPFMEESMDLLSLNSKAVMPEKVVKDLKISICWGSSGVARSVNWGAPHPCRLLLLPFPSPF